MRLTKVFPAKAQPVSKIVRETGAKIVWSTSWRLFEPCKSDIGAASDDMTEAGIALPDNCRFFKTSERRGVTPKIAEKIILYLNTGKTSRRNANTASTPAIN